MAGWYQWLMYVSLSELQELVMDREARRCCNSWGRKESDMTERLNWTELKSPRNRWKIVCYLVLEAEAFLARFLAPQTQPLPPTLHGVWDMSNAILSSNIPKIQVLGDSFSWGNMQSYACAVWFADPHWTSYISTQNSSLHSLLVPKILSVR